MKRGGGAMDRSPKLSLIVISPQTFASRLSIKLLEKKRSSPEFAGINENFSTDLHGR